MEEERSFATRVLSIIGFALLAFAIAILAGGVWSALLVTNLRSNPTVPWSVPVMALLLWLMWSYLGGKGWPQSTSNARRRYLRANRRSARTYLWSFAAGGLSVVALSGYWIVLFRLVKMPPNALPDMSSYPRMTVALMILMGSSVAPFMEEAGFRGYFQVALEGGGSRFGRGHHLLPGLCLRALLPWHLVAKAFDLLSCGRHIWHDGVSHQLYASGHSATHDRRSYILRLGVAA
jgi:membrane protease YdiL (CAAX protease family)